MNFNLTPEQKQKIINIVIQGVVAMIMAVLAVLGYNIAVVQPQFNQQAAQNAAWRAELGIESFKPEGGVGALAAPINISGNPVRCKQNAVACLTAWNGGTVGLYSDGGTTAKFTASGATGNVYAAGFLRLGAGSTISVTDSAVITPTATYQPLQSAGTVTATAVLTTGFTAGQMVTLINTSNTSIVLTNGTYLKLPSASNLTLGQYDSVELWFDGTRWVAIAASNN